MRLRRHALSVLCLILLVTTSSYAQVNYKVSDVIDGDTIKVDGLPDIRLLLIDAPELGKECYAKEAKLQLEKLIGNSKIELKIDPKLPNLDNRKKRLVRYIFVNGRNLNLQMVELGAAAPWFYYPKKGKFDEELRIAAEEAKSKKIGLWGACPDAVLNTSKELQTGKLVQSNPKPSAKQSIFITPGSFCPEIGRGTQRSSKSGTMYTCKTSESENRLRWRKS